MSFIRTVRADKIFKIIIDRPNKKNAIDKQMYIDIVQALSASATCHDTSITVLCGSGEYYSSGNDLSNFLKGADDIPKLAAESKTSLTNFVHAFINHPKPLVAVVQGPAIGIAVTTLALCDLVYASDKATFHTPFSTLGQTPEGCSSFTFPVLMGYSQANEVLYFGRKLSAYEALDRRLVSGVFAHDRLDTAVWPMLHKYSLQPSATLRRAKQVVRGAVRAQLIEANEREVNMLVQCWQSEDCANAVLNFFQNQQKKAKM